MFGITRIASLVLAFTLGFSMCLGIIGFGTMSAISKFRVRDLERYGIIANIPDESFMTEDPEVDILDLSLIEFIDELKFITALGDQVNLNYVQDRYGLIFHEKLDAVLSDETRQMPLKQLFSKEGFGNVLGSVYIGNIENYICYNADGTEGGKPGVDGAYWMTADGTKITGIEEIIANFSINDFVSGKINTDTLFDDISIGDVLGYTQDGDNWYDKEGKKVTGVIAAFAGSTIHSVGSDIDNIMIGEILGYEKNEADEWCKKNDAGELEKVTGVMAVFADSKINDIGNEIEEAKLGELLGYELVDDVWYKRNSETDELEKVTGVMAVFADSDINGIGDKIETAELGELLGYELVDDVWYKRNSETDELEKVTGVMAVFSDCNINGIGDKLEDAQLGELLGYELIDNVWYKYEIDSETNEEKPVKVTGAMAVFADSNINGVGDEIENTEVGMLLGYELIDGVWYEPSDKLDEDGNRVPVSGFMSKISASTINNMGGVFDTLVIGDIVKEEDREKGIFAIIKADTEITNIGSAVNDSIMNSPFQFFMNEGLITFDTSAQATLDRLCNTLGGDHMLKISIDSDDYKKFYKDVEGTNWTIEDGYCYIPAWRNKPLSESFGYIVNLLTAPTIPV